MQFAPMARRRQEGAEGVGDEAVALADAATQIRQMIVLNEARMRQLRDSINELDDLLEPKPPAGGNSRGPAK